MFLRGKKNRRNFNRRRFDPKLLDDLPGIIFTIPYILILELVHLRHIHNLLIHKSHATRFVKYDIAGIPYKGIRVHIYICMQSPSVICGTWIVIYRARQSQIAREVTSAASHLESHSWAARDDYSFANSPFARATTIVHMRMYKVICQRSWIMRLSGVMKFNFANIRFPLFSFVNLTLRVLTGLA